MGICVIVLLTLLKVGQGIRSKEIVILQPMKQIMFFVS